MISYAQNHEDVLLNRCFGGQPSGFYIDVGAWEPVLHSVTHHFYEQGWHGVNIEPVSQYYEMLVEARPRDVNLRCALSDERGDLVFSVVDGSGLSTPRSLGDQLVTDLAAGGYSTHRETVSAMTLADVCRLYVSVGQDVDFLKVDVEGWETKVLNGGDWDAYRPRVVVVETVTPFGFDPSDQRVEVEDLSSEWEADLLDKGYLFATADGLNRWFVRSEDESLLEHFRFPVNAVDDFVPYSLITAQQQVRELHARVGDLQEQLDDSRVRFVRNESTIAASEAQARVAPARYEEVLNSTSWRLTAPMRTTSALWRRRREALRALKVSPIQPPTPLRVALYAGVYVEHDAVSNSLRHKLDILQGLAHHGYPVMTTVFTQGTDYDEPNIVVISPDELERHPDFIAADVHVFEFGMHYELFDKHAALPADVRVLIIDHSTTPPELVQSADARLRCGEAIARRDQLSWAHRIVNDSEHNLEHHLACGEDHRKLSVLHLPPTIATGRAVVDSPPIESRPGPVHLLFVGRLTRAKGILDLLDAFERLTSRHSGVQLTLVGSTRFAEEDIVERIMVLIDRLGADGPLRLMSGLTNDELSTVFRSAHALVLPSYHEGYCVPVVEAMWAGAFPITYDAGNLPKVSGGLGGLIPTGDVTQLEHALIEFVTRVESARTGDGELMLHTSRRGDLSEDAWRAAAAAHLVDYSLDSYIDSFLRVLGEIMADRPLGAPEWLVRDRAELVRTVRPGL